MQVESNLASLKRQVLCDISNRPQYVSISISYEESIVEPTSNEIKSALEVYVLRMFTVNKSHYNRIDTEKMTFLLVFVLI